MDEKRKPAVAPNGQTFEIIAQQFKALGDPIRLRLIYLLKQGPKSVGEIAKLAGCSQPNASRHLAQLRSQGLLKRTQSGNTVYYEIGDPTVFQLCETVCSRLERDAKRWQDLLLGESIG